MRYRVLKTLAYHRTLVYLVDAADPLAARDIVQADMGLHDPVADELEMDSDPDDSYSVEECADA